MKKVNKKIGLLSEADPFFACIVVYAKQKPAKT